MKIAISSGHGAHVSGASALPRPPMLNEHPEAVRVVDQVYADLHDAGVQVVKFEETTATSQQQNLDNIINWHNAQDRDLDVSVHFNSSDGTTSALMGSECYYYTKAELAAQVSAAIASAADWPNRGGKQNKSLQFLNRTNKPAILIEVCFVNSSADGTRFYERFTQICAAIAHTIGGTVAPSPEPEPDPGVETISLQLASDRPVNLRIVASTNVTIVNGEAPDALPSYQQNLIATEFYGDGGPGAYGIPIPGAASPALYIALPWKNSELERSEWEVTNVDTGQSGVGEVWDLGPWCVADNYIEKQTRSIAEQYNGQPMPSIPGVVPDHNVGVVSNGASVDLSPALAKMIGINGKGRVNIKRLL